MGISFRIEVNVEFKTYCGRKTVPVLLAALKIPRVKTHIVEAFRSASIIVYLVACGLRLTATSSPGVTQWRDPVRGTWIREDEITRPGDIVLVDRSAKCEIVVAPNENSAVKQAAVFLSGDIETITGFKPSIVVARSGGVPAIHLCTVTGNAVLPQRVKAGSLVGKWESYQILTDGSDVWLVGSNFRGTAFAAYTLSERLGIDPLYLWTGYKPAHHSILVLEATDFFQDPPVFRYRGFFHDDEDILPRPFDESGYPLETGTVPLRWYERFFETALRLRLNQVAPYVRVQRYHDVQKLASDWGLYYSSHHYDILLSNPYGFQRFGLGRLRNAGSEWDWFNNREGMLNFWRGGVLENRDVNCIWPVGLRNTNDYGYDFPDGMTDAEKNSTFREVIDAQVKMTKELLPLGSEAIFHFTLYTEMLNLYQKGKLNLPPEVIVVWPDDNDGHMRALPVGKDTWRHGVYYHLAYYDGGDPTKQVTHIINPATIDDQFGKIVSSGATEYLLVNVSELREFIMEARMIAAISWNGSESDSATVAADHYVGWWCREYFGEPAASDAVATYEGYYRLLDKSSKIWLGQTQVIAALNAMGAKFSGGATGHLQIDALPALEERDKAYGEVMSTARRAEARMNAEQRQYFFENAELGMLIDWRQTQAAILLDKAVFEPNVQQARLLCFRALDTLNTLEAEISRAERYPFEKWYRETWIRNADAPSNVHRSFKRTREFIIQNFLKP